MSRGTDAWPALPLERWRATYETLHRWTQIVGKTKLGLAPMQNHWWQVALHVTARGLTTGPMPSADRTLEVAFDFVDHQVTLAMSDGSIRRIDLEPISVADFYGRYRAALDALGVTVRIWPMPVEIENPIRFTEDRVHHTYDRAQAQTFWRVLARVDQVFKEFRGEFLGKCSPVHFFWGSFDLAVTRFSGRRAPERPDADAVTREAYSHEVISAGFWPGSGTVQEAAFYAYAAPEPPGLGDATIGPGESRYDRDLSEFILPYEAVRVAPAPERALLEFLHRTYDAAATLAHWDRAAVRPSSPPSS